MTMTDKLPVRVKSAAFLRRKLNPEQPTTKETVHQPSIIAALPVSESRLTIRLCSLENCRKTTSVVKGNSAKTNTSEIWRQIHSTRSEFKLRSLSRGVEQEPVRINLVEKVDRIKSKHFQQEKVYKRCLEAISRKTVEKNQMMKSQGHRGELEKMIMQLLAPFQQAKSHAEDRYRARLLKVRRC